MVDTLGTGFSKTSWVLKINNSTPLEIITIHFSFGFGVERENYVLYFKTMPRAGIVLMHV